MRTLLATCCLAVLLAAAGPVVAEDSPGDGVFALTPETGDPLTFKDCYRTLRASDERPDRVTAAPEDVERWLVFPWGEGEAVVALLEEALVADRDGDGDLAEEPAVARSRGGTTSIELDLAMPSRTIRTFLQLREVGSRGFRIVNRTRMAGEVVLRDRRMKVSLTDYLANGRYDDYRTTRTEEYWLCDHIHLDRNGDGEFRKYIPPTGEDHSLARAVVVGDTLYECIVLDRGERLRFAPSGRALHVVNANTAKYTIRLVSDELGSCGLPCMDGVGRLPAGRYRWEAYDYRVEGARVSGLFWEEDGVRHLDVKGDAVVDIAGDLRYELFAEVDDEGDLLFRTLCYGPLGARVMIWLDGVGSIKPELTVETDEREVLYRVTSNYC